MVRGLSGATPSRPPNTLLLTQFHSLPMSPIQALTNHCLVTDIMLNADIIIEAIHELSLNSAAGPDCIPSSLLVNCATELAPVLLLIFSHSLSHGVIPKSWKRAAIIPIYKSGDKTVPSNYRPISLTSVICKVLERIIRKQVFSFLDQKGCLNSTQHGFRPGLPVCQCYWMFLIILCTC